MARVLPVVLLGGLVPRTAARSPSHGSSVQKGLRRICVDPVVGAVYPPAPGHLKLDLPSPQPSAQQGSSVWTAGRIACSVTGVAGTVVTHPHWFEAARRELQSWLRELRGRAHCAWQRKRKTSAPDLQAIGATSWINNSTIPCIALSLALVAAVGARAGTRRLGRVHPEVEESSEDEDMTCEVHLIISESDEEEMACEFHRMHSELVENRESRNFERFANEKKSNANEVECVYDSLAAEFHRLATPGIETGGFVRKRTLELNQVTEAMENEKRQHSKTRAELDAHGA